MDTVKRSTQESQSTEALLRERDALRAKMVAIMKAKGLDGAWVKSLGVPVAQGAEQQIAVMRTVIAAAEAK